MTKKQKQTLARILTAGVLFAALFVGERLGWIDALETLLGTPRPLLPLGLYLAVYLLIGWDVVWKALRNISHGQVFDENFLMLVATVAAFCIGEYEEAVAVMLFYQVGELFQSCAVDRSRRSISELMEIAPEFANVELGGRLVELEPDEVEIGSVIVVRPGERVPLDGVVLEGESLLDTAALTGESVPRRVRPGDAILSGCINGDTALRVRTTKEYDDSTVARILELVENAGEKKARSEQFITRFARWYTPVVTVAALLLGVVPPLFVGGWGEWIRRACVFLVISCPCALVISVPLGFFGGVGAAARAGVLVKGSSCLETAARMKTLVFDKTGTLTCGEFAVSEVRPVCCSGTELLELAALAEGYSDHPIAASIRRAWAENGAVEAERASAERIRAFSTAGTEDGAVPDLTRVRDAEALPGRGVRATVDGREVLLGNRRLLEENKIGIAKAGEDSGQARLVPAQGNGDGAGAERTSAGADQSVPCDSGATVVYVAVDGAYRGCIVIGDRVKDGAREALAELKQAGVRRCVMLTGDRQEAAEAVARSLGIDEVRAELLPADKVTALETLLGEGGAVRAERAFAGADQSVPYGRDAGNGALGFVGDGINDAPVLMRADLGFAMGSMGSDAAIEAADVVIMDDRLDKLPRFLRIAGKTLRIVRQNIVFALGVKLAILALGAFGLAGLWLAVFADVGVAVLAILNSMRMLQVK